MLKATGTLRKQFSFSALLRRFLLSWLLAVLLEYLLLPSELRDLNDLGGLAHMSLPRVIGSTFVAALFLTGISFFSNTHSFERWGIYFVFTALSITACCASFSFQFFWASLLILLVFTVFGIYGWNDTPEQITTTGKTKKVYIWITAGLSVILFLFICLWTLGRIYCFRAPCYDFGIFSQMFYYMKETGLPLTTVERDGLLSHFAVHISPIYYLLLPFYCIFPTPVTLQVLQALIITSAVIPLWKLGKHFGLSGVQRMLVCAVLLLYPAYSGGAGYDIHENCFLTPLLLWLLYAIAVKNTPLISMTTILTLSVKEDAAVYVAVLGLWLIVKSILQFSKKNLCDILTGGVLLIMSVGWFFFATGYLSRNGDGVMNYRYENYMYDGSSLLITVIKSVLLNPMKAIYECADSEKLFFIAMTMLPLICLPLLTRRYERYILLIPYILVNLMSDYPYQHDIFFQYTFGSIALLMYLTVINLADIKQDNWRLNFLTTAVVISAICFLTVVTPKALQYPSQAIQNYEHYQDIRQTLDSIPDDASVSATTYYATYLSQRETLYTIQYSSTEHILSTEYIVLNPNLDEYALYSATGKGNGYDHFVSLLKYSGYSQYGNSGGDLVIYYRSR